jgi:lipopolysaccharide transport system ATP-binding protein
LKDVSVEIEVGDVVGLVGRNGAGKTTLLKILSRITSPTDGEAVVHGRVGSLLEVGTGFHPELTGRENVFLNGAILGMKRREIHSKFDEIVAFAEVEKFIDTPVKRYSSGMRVRLAFAVAAHLEPEILLVDEVLAVGDAAFQRRCLGKMDEVALGGRTVLFVSHNMAAVHRLCRRVLWIDGGSVAADAAPGPAVESYLESVQEGHAEALGLTSADGRFVIDSVALLDRAGAATTVIAPGEPITVEVSFHAREPVVRPYFWIGVSGRFGHLFGANMLLDGVQPESLEGRGSLRCVFEEPRLMPQQSYYVRLGARQADGRTPLIVPAEVASFRVAGSPGALGLDGDYADGLAGDSTSILLPYTWQLPDGRTVSVGSKVGDRR